MLSDRETLIVVAAVAGTLILLNIGKVAAWLKRLCFGNWKHTIATLTIAPLLANVFLPPSLNGLRGTMSAFAELMVTIIGLLVVCYAITIPFKKAAKK